MIGIILAVAAGVVLGHFALRLLARLTEPRIRMRNVGVNVLGQEARRKERRASVLLAAHMHPSGPIHPVATAIQEAPSAEPGIVLRIVGVILVGAAILWAGSLLWELWRAIRDKIGRL